MKKLAQLTKDFFDIPVVMYIWTVVVSMGFIEALYTKQHWWAAFTAGCLLAEGIDFCVTNKGRKV